MKKNCENPFFILNLDVTVWIYIFFLMKKYFQPKSCYIKQLVKCHTILFRGCLNFVFDAEKARFFVQIDAFLRAIEELRLEKKRENFGGKDAFFKPKDKI